MKLPKVIQEDICISCLIIMGIATGYLLIAEIGFLASLLLFLLGIMIAFAIYWLGYRRCREDKFEMYVLERDITAFYGSVPYILKAGEKIFRRRR